MSRPVSSCKCPSLWSIRFAFLLAARICRCLSTPDARGPIGRMRLSRLISASSISIGVMAFSPLSLVTLARHATALSLEGVAAGVSVGRRALAREAAEFDRKRCLNIKGGNRHAKLTPLTFEFSGA